MTNETIDYCDTDELLARVPGPRTWLWERFLTPGKLTLFTSKAKDGKTTLTSLLVKLMEEGGELIGSKVAKGKIVLATEEDNDDWVERCRLLGIGRHVKWCVRPIRGIATWDDWDKFVRSMGQWDADLYMIDPLAPFLPAHAENSSATVLRAMHPLRELGRMKKGAVLTLHHPSEGPKGMFNVRGNGALKGEVDILMELKRLPGAAFLDRRRTLACTSRYQPVYRTIELNEAKTGYAVLTETPPDGSFEAGWVALKIVLEDATERLTRESIQKHWPPDYDKPSGTTLRRWLEQALKEKRIERFGKGRCASPFRYALPGRKFDKFGMPDPPDFDEMDRERWG